MGCSVWHSIRKEKGRAYLEDALVAGKGLGEDRTNGAAARPVVAAREGREERVLCPRDGKGETDLTERGDEPEALSGWALSGWALSMRQ